MKSCSLCGNNSIQQTELCFYGLPKHRGVKEEWLEVLGPNKNTTGLYVCEVHFRPVDFSAGLKKELKPYAVPALKLGKDVNDRVGSGDEFLGITSGGDCKTEQPLSPIKIKSEPLSDDECIVKQEPIEEEEIDILLKLELNYISDAALYGESMPNANIGPPQVMPNPGSSTPLQRWQAFQQLVLTQNLPLSRQQQEEVLTILKSNPHLMAAYIKQWTQEQQMLGMPNPGPSPSMQQLKAAMQQLLQVLKSTPSLQQSEQVLAILKSNPHLMSVFIKQGTQQKELLVKPNPGPSNKMPRSDALQQLLKVLKSPRSPQQSEQVLTILKFNPHLMAAFIKQRTQQKELLVKPNPGPSNKMPRSDALQQLLKVLKSPRSPQQLEQVLTILKFNPHLMAAFIKQRTWHQQQQMLLNKGTSSGGHNPTCGTSSSNST